ncbi:hypothetical protein VTN02DRAFT_2917 [Thermoascus thermophilus]
MCFSARAFQGPKGAMAYKGGKGDVVCSCSPVWPVRRANVSHLRIFENLLIYGTALGIIVQSHGNPCELQVGW